MACIIKYTKVGETEEREYTEAEFLALLAEGELQKLDEAGIIDAKDILGEVPPPEPPKGKEKKSGGEEREKAIMKKAFEGTTTDEVKAEIENLGLTYISETHAEAAKIAEEFIDRVGIDNALWAMQTQLEGAPKAIVWGKLVDHINKQIINETDPEKRKVLERQEAEMLDAFNKEARIKGQFISAIYHVLKNSDFGYKLATQKQMYKDANDGFLPADVEARMEEYDKHIKEINEKLKEAEAKLKAAEDELAIKNIQSEAANEAKELPKKQKQLKKAIEDLGSITIGSRSNKASLTSDKGKSAIRNAAAKFLRQQNAKFREFIQIVEKEVGTLTDAEKAIFKQEFEDEQAKFDAENETKSGIPKSLIRELVEGGIRDIDELTKAVMERLEIEDTPENFRRTRDDITGYGKTTNPSKDEIAKEISKLTSIGRLKSALEDVQNGLRAKKSGLQRRKLLQQERDLMKQIKELSKNLPMDEADLAKYQKTALDTLKTRLRNRIEDLKAEIESRTKLNRSNKKVEYDAEALELVAEKEELEKQHDEIFSKMPLSDEQRIQRAINAIENSIELFNKRIEIKSFTAAEKEPLPSDPKLDAARAELAAKKAEYEAEKEKAMPNHKSIKATENAVKAVERKVREIESRILNNQLEKEKKQSLVQQTEALKIAKAKLAEKMDFLNKLREEADIPQQQRIDKLEEAARRRIESLKDRLETGNFAKGRHIFKDGKIVGFKPQGEKFVVDSGELNALQAEKLRWQEKYDLEIYKLELQNANRWKKAWKTIVGLLGIQRALMATGEMSGLSVQGWKYLTSHPILAAKSVVEMFKHFASEKHAEEFLLNLKSSPIYPEIVASKLRITDSTQSGKQNAQEELFLGGWVSRIINLLGTPLKLLPNSRLWTPIDWIKAGITGNYIEPANAYERWKKLNPNDAFSRAQSGLLDSMRLLRYEQGREMLIAQGKTFMTHPEEFKNIAAVVNRATGAADLGALEPIAGGLAQIFFSPRNWASILNDTTPLGLITLVSTHNPTDKWYKPSVAQKMAIRDYLVAFGTTTAVVALIAAAYKNDDDDDDRPIVEKDPTSSNFGKIRIGNTFVDPFGGRLPQIVYNARFWYNSIKSSTTGEIKNLGQEYTPSRLDLSVRQVRGKLAPLPALIVKGLAKRTNAEGEDVDEFGQPYDAGKQILDNLYPMWYGTIAELHKEQPEAVALALDAAAYWGIGVQTLAKDKVRTEVRKEFSDIVGKAGFEKAATSISESNLSKILDKEFKIADLQITQEQKDAINVIRGKQLVEFLRKNPDVKDLVIPKHLTEVVNKVLNSANKKAVSEVLGTPKNFKEEETKELQEAKDLLHDALINERENRISQDELDAVKKISEMNFTQTENYLKDNYGSINEKRKALNRMLSTGAKTQKEVDEIAERLKLTDLNSQKDAAKGFVLK